MRTTFSLLTLLSGACYIGSLCSIFSQAAVANFSSYGSPAGGEAKPGAIAVDGLGCVYLVGSSHNGTNTDLAIVKFGCDGKQLWSRMVDGLGHGDDTGVAVAIEGTNCVIVAGMLSSGQERGRDIVVIKYSTDGEQRWSQLYHAPEPRGEWYRDERAVSLKLDGGANVYVAGVADQDINFCDWLVLKYGPDGNPVWTNRFRASAGWGDPAAAEVDGQGNVLLVGTDGPENGYECTIVKVSAGGQGVWTNRWHDPARGSGSGRALACDATGNIYVLAESHALKYSPNGTLLWSHPFPGKTAGTVVCAPGDRVMIAGITAVQDNDLIVLSLNPSGTALWTNRYRFQFDTASPVAISNPGDGTVHLVANARETHEESGNSRKDVLLLHYSSAGLLLGEERFGAWDPTSIYASAVAVDQAGRAFIAGYGNTGTNSSTVWVHLFAPSFAPPLAVHGSGAELVFSWPVLASNVVLESSSSLGAFADWKAITNARNQLGTWWTVTNQVRKAAEYYRLRSN